jgi:hypothetical protein
MKRFTLMAVMVLAMAAMVCTSDAAEFSGKWIAHKMEITSDGESMIVDMDEGDGTPEEERARVEFKDGKVYFADSGADDEPTELEYKSGSDKTPVMITPEMKEEGVESIEIFFEGESLCMFYVMSGEESGTIKTVFRKMQ